jgi:hypothetical protein
MRLGINQHTLEKICERGPVWAIKLAKRLKILDEMRRQQQQETGWPPNSKPRLIRQGIKRNGIVRKFTNVLPPNRLLSWMKIFTTILGG